MIFYNKDKLKLATCFESILFQVCHLKSQQYKTIILYLLQHVVNNMLGKQVNVLPA